MRPLPLYLQLHSLRRETAVDPDKTLRQVPTLGFAGIELVSDYGWTAARWQTILEEAGLSVAAAHVSLETLENEFSTKAAFYRTLGARHLVVTALPRATQSATRYHDGARRLNTVARRLATEGLSVSYHNHDFEFQWTESGGGKCGLDILLAETDPALVGFEFDTFWLEHAGRNAVAWIERHANRTRFIHAKDLRQRDRQDVPAGQGDVDFCNLLPLCAKHGWPVVLEYEGSDAVESVRQGVAFLRSIPV